MLNRNGHAITYIERYDSQSTHSPTASSMHNVFIDVYEAWHPTEVGGKCKYKTGVG